MALSGQKTPTSVADDEHRSSHPSPSLTERSSPSMYARRVKPYRSDERMRLRTDGIHPRPLCGDTAP